MGTEDKHEYHLFRHLSQPLLSFFEVDHIPDSVEVLFQ
jgi:hypothetical protein